MSSYKNLSGESLLDIACAQNNMKKLEEYIADLKGETKGKLDGYVDEERVLLKMLKNEHIKNKHMIG